MIENDALGDSQFDLTLLSNFVHQVINPLNAVAGTIDGLEQGHIEPHRAPQRMRAARAQLEQAITLVRNLAFFSGGFHELKRESARVVVVPQVIIESAMFFQELGKQRSVHIHLENRNQQNKLYGDPELIRQVFMNIFDNAVKYSKKDTKVVVVQRIQKSTSDVIVEILSEMDVQMSKADLPYIFDVGFRGSNAKSVVASGTGLGLFICREIVERVHNGKIEVEIVDGGAMRFRVRIPGGFLD